MLEDLESKVAVVTGAAAGIGATYASALVREGVRVAFVDLDADGARAAAQRADPTGERAIAFGVDISDEQAVATTVEQIVASFGGVDILVNNAALHLGEWSLGTALPFEKWRRILDVNVLGQLACAVACRPHMAARGGGAILNQSSVAAYHGAGGAYGVSKLALNGLTMVLAREFAPEGIRVNGIAPGFVASPAAVARVIPANRERVRSAQLIAREGQMEDLVGTMLYLVSAASGFVTGQTICVDGGGYARP